MSSQPLQFIWDNQKIPECIKIPESDITLEQVRRSCGIETNPATGIRSYFVPIPKKIDEPPTEEVAEDE